MNRWLKYGGIMPETINISGIEIIQNSSYFDSGSYANANNYQRINTFIPVSSGKYILKFIVNQTETVELPNLRVIGYNAEKQLIGMIFRKLTLPLNRINVILKYEMNITNQKYIRLSYRSSIQLLEIEKL